MMSVKEQIENMMSLDDRKDKIYSELVSVENDIKGQQDSCKHINVYLGDEEVSIFKFPMIRCLKCGRVSCYEEYQIDASNYATKFDLNDEKQCYEKFDLIRTLALGLAREDYDVEEDELASRVNDLIQSPLAKKSSQSTVKEKVKK